MEPRLARARESVDAAAELTDDSTVHEQLNSIRNALDALSDATSGNSSPEDDAPDDATPDDVTEKGARLEQVERQLAQLGDDAGGLTAEHIRTARDQVDEYRRAEAPDWE